MSCVWFSRWRRSVEELKSLSLFSHPLQHVSLEPVQTSAACAHDQVVVVAVVVVVLVDTVKVTATLLFFLAECESHHDHVR